MGKNKRQRLIGPPGRVMKSNSKGSLQKRHSIGKKENTSPKTHTQAQHSAPTVPFLPEDRILLIGEGDLSFARSLVEHHSCTNVTATVLERSLEELTTKYPHAGDNVAAVVEGGGKVQYGIDATKMSIWTEGVKGGRVGLMDRIIFNFPHVGGKSTDVNRQVRYNQELLVSFFTKAMPSLALGGSIIITLFEGEPYTLWNVRDLARHSGLQVERSFKFQATAYPGYHHSRTLGVVKSKTGEAGAGWKGEDRPARSYIFIRKGEELRDCPSKRKRDNTSSDDGVDD